MKKIFLCVVSVCLIFALCSCGIVNVDKNAEVELVFHHGDVSVKTQLTQQQAKEITDIFDGKVLINDMPSCGFDESIAFIIDGKIYCPACDDCCIVKDCNSGQFFNISREQRDSIEEIFSAYGGYFPCV